jgi:uncharacterized protein YbjQ (UPF0145 family)
MRLYDAYEFIIESKSSEMQGLKIMRLADVEDGETLMGEFVAADKSKNQKNLPIMAFLYAKGGGNVKAVVDIVNNYEDLVTKNRVKQAQVTRNGIVMGDKVFGDSIKFSKYIQGEKNKYGKLESRDSTAEDYTAEDKPMWSGNNIDIYDATDIGKCIKYTQGALTGIGYRFCIGQFNNTQYKSYRDTKTSTFYFIVDRNKFKTDEQGNVNLDDPLHIVVFDVTSHGIELTDANNDTNTIAYYGRNTDGYVKYLESKGVPVDKMVNKPKSDQEEEEDRVLGRPNRDLQWFMNLPVKYKSAYIGRGHVLTNDQFDYLIDN